jgi:hypothetical protein
MNTTKWKQSGSVLLVALVMITLLTLLVLSAINSGTVNLRIAGNMQAQDGARAVAQQAIEKFISDYKNFCTNSPPAPCTKPVPGGIAATGYDIDNDGTAEFSVTVSPPVCIQSAHQVPGRSEDCKNGYKAGISCWDTLWQVQATATDSKSGASQTVIQGVAISFDPSFQPTTAGCG